MMRDGIAMNRRLGSAQAIGAMRRLAIALQHHDRDDEALAQLEEVWALCQKNGMTGQQECVTIRANLAHMLADRGEGERALAEADAAIASFAGYAPEGLISELGQADQARAAALAAVGRHDEAVALQDAVVSRLRAHYGDDHQETISAISARKRLVELRGSR